jgi:uncharacterized repeat protein (TIGR01451 family)
MRGRLSVPRRLGRCVRSTCPLHAEVLEGRQLLTTFTVLTTADSGPGSLRQAILDANSAVFPGLDLINFNIGTGGAQTIAPLSPLPTIAEAVVINGTSQPGFTGTPLIELNGSLAGASASGLQLAVNTVAGTSSSGSTVRGLVINRFSGAGISVQTSDNAIVGNYLGTNAVGMAALPNGRAGVDIRAGDNNTIGGLTAADRNVISGNSVDGIFLFNSGPRGNIVVGNYIGTAANGTTPLGNSVAGIEAQFSNNNLIGGTTAAARNVISGNMGDGIRLTVGASANRVQGNYIGTDVTGTVTRANRDSGIFIENSSLNTIGGAAAAQRNLISGNGANGIRIQNLVSTGQTFTSTDVPRRVPPVATGGSGDPTQDVTTSTLTIAGVAGSIIDLNVNLTLIHTFDSDLVISLIAPDNTIVLLSNHRGSVGDNFSGTTFDDQAAIPIAFGSPPFSGSFQPETPLSVLNGLSPNGVWQLQINDSVPVDAGFLQSWSLSLQGGLPTSASTSNVVQGNFIGTDVTGTQALGNQGSGISLSGGTQNVIGGTVPGASNLISANVGGGVLIAGADALNTTVQGNFIGTDATGTQALGNQGSGISLSGGTQSTIGGAVPEARNLISGNSGSGILITGGVTNTTVQGNFIGTDATGTQALGNSLAGVDDQSGIGTRIDTGNIISANGAGGVNLSGTATAAQVQGNRIGTDGSGTQDLGNVGFGVRIATGNNTIGGPAGPGNIIAFTRPDPSGRGPGVTVASGAFGNSILSNAISNNAGLGIDLNDDGAVQLNDPGDGDAGANNGQNFPEISQAGTGIVGGATLIQGIFNSQPNAAFTLQFFANTASDPSGFGEGQTLLTLPLGSSDVTTDGSGNAVFSFTFPVDTSGQFITATATRLVDADSNPATPLTPGNTSEFSPAVLAVAAPATDLSVAIGAFPPQGMINESLSYTVTVSNAGAIDATDVVLTTNVPATTAFVSATGSVTPVGGILTFPLGTILAGASSTVTITVIPTAVGTITLQASVATSLIDTNLANNTARLNTPVGAPAGTVAVQFLSETFNGLEADGSAVITVIRDSGIGTTTVNFNVSDGTAQSGLDYALPIDPQTKTPIQTLTFNPGELVKTFIILVTNDFVREADETVLLNLNSPSGAVLNSPVGAVLTIRDNDPTSPGAGSFRFSNPTYEVDENGGIFQMIVVERVGGQQGDVAVDFSTGGGTAQPFDPLTGVGDYAARQFTVTFADGDVAPKFLFIQVLNDKADLGNKTANLILSNPRRIRILRDPFRPDLPPSFVSIPNDEPGKPVPTLGGPSEAVLTITDVLPPPVFPQTVMFNAAAYAVDERAGTATITVTRSSAEGQVRVNFATSNGTAVAGVRYTATSSLLTFNPGETFKSFTIPILDNTVQDGDRTVNVTLSNPSTNLSIAIPSTVVLTIVDDETPRPPVLPSVMFGAPAYSVDERAGTVTLFVTRTDFSNTVTVDFATIGGTATAGVKYLPVAGTLVFNPNETAKVFTIPIINTNEFEGTQTVVVGLRNPQGTGLGAPGTAVLSILDDETPPPPPLSPGSISFGNATFNVAENRGTATITLVRTGGSSGAVTVIFSTGGGTAIPGVRYTPVNTAVSFANGQTTATVTVPILDDAIADGNQSIGLLLTDPTGGATLGTQGTATLTILDNEVDTSPPTVQDIQLLGGGRTITGVVLTFSELLDVARASNRANFSFTALGRDGRPGTRDDRAIGVQSVSYDPATGNLVVVPDRPLRGNQFYRLVINAAAPSGLADQAGIPLDGDDDGVSGGSFSVSFSRAQQLRYPDRNGDIVTLRLARGGVLDLTRFADGEGRDLRLLGARPGRSVLSGNVLRRRRIGDGRTTLQTITGLDPNGTIRSRLRTPPFFIGQIVPTGVDTLLAQGESLVDRRSSAARRS